MKPEIFRNDENPFFSRYFARGFSVLLIAVAAPATLNARPAALRCNKEQTSCVIDKKDSTVGDNILFINKNDEVVASGTVEQVSGTERTVKIEKHNGPILRSDRFALADPSNRHDMALSWKEYHKEPQMAVGAELGMMSIRSASGITAYTVGGNFDYQLPNIWRNLYAVGAADFMIANGTASRNDPVVGIDSEPVSADGLGVLGGAAVRLLDQYDLQPRAEAGVGFMYISGTVGGDGGNFDGAGFNTGMNQGIGLYSRLKGSMLYRMEAFTAELGGSMHVIHQTLGYGLTLGAVKDIK